MLIDVSWYVLDLRREFDPPLKHPGFALAPSLPILFALS
jgi:hypothetical protein